MKYEKCGISVEYTLDDSKKITIHLEAKIPNNKSIEECHEEVYLKAVESLNNIINITMIDEDEE
jgi:hypothetical protein